MKRNIILIIIILFLTAPLSAQAGRPTPYPQPGQEAQMYPGPEPTVPAVTPTPGVKPSPTPVILWPDPRIGYPYAWGYLDGRWVVTLDGAGLSPDLQGVQCIRNINTGQQLCYPLRWVYWYPTIDRNVFYMQVPNCLTGYWEVLSVFIIRYGDVRQPNEYAPGCKQHLPIFRNG